MLVSVAAMFVAVETLSWVFYLLREPLRDAVAAAFPTAGAHLDAYEVMDETSPRHWRLRPGYVATTDELIAEKLRQRKWLSAKSLENAAATGKNMPFVINDHGFKGEQLNTEHPCPRVLFIGDSVTFGIGGMSYPRYMKLAFARRGVEIEVVNAGVEGYTPRNALLEVDRYAELNPEMVIIYIGWNALFQMPGHSLTRIGWLKTPWMLRHAEKALVKALNAEWRTAQLDYRKPLRADLDDPVVQDLRSTRPEFADTVLNMIDALRAHGMDVRLVTLFGLFQYDQAPGDRALEMGYLPDWTDNPYVLAAMTDSYNDFVRSIAGRNGVQVIDFQAWGRDNLTPREDFFSDSVHFNPDGLRRFGEFLADKIALDLERSGKTCPIAVPK